MRVLFGFLGLIGGGFIGLWIGVGIGELIATLADISCFEGGCGYFVAAIGLLGILLGAIAGLIAGILFAGRRLRAAKAAAGPTP
jgi:hypothetical protein